jgi:hypothetical protein
MGGARVGRSGLEGAAHDLRRGGGVGERPLADLGGNEPGLVGAGGRRDQGEAGDDGDGDASDAHRRNGTPGGRS